MRLLLIIFLILSIFLSVYAAEYGSKGYGCGFYNIGCANSPNLTIIYPANISYSYNVTQLNYTISNDAQACWYSPNNGITNTTITCGTNVTGANSSEGSNTWLMSANNSGNNISISRVTFVKDTIAPNISVISPLEGQIWIVSGVLFNVSATDLSGISAYLFTENDGISNTSFDGDEYISHADGSYGLIFYVNDTLNNRNQSVKINFVVKQSSQGAGGGGASAETLRINVSAYLCSKTYNKTIFQILNIIDEIKIEINKTESWVNIWRYIFNWNVLCEKIMKKKTGNQTITPEIPEVSEVKVKAFPYWILIILVVGIFVLITYQNKKKLMLIILAKKRKRRE